jgi:hypothetical protein
MTLPKNNKREMFYFDKKNGIIRWQASGGYILSVEDGPVKNGRKLVVKPWRGGTDHTQRYRYISRGYGNFKSYENQKMCIDCRNGRSNDYVHMWSCHRGMNQRWSVTGVGNKKFNAKRSKIQNRRFRIRTQMSGNRVLYFNEHMGGG